MKENRYIISKHDELVLLFDEYQPSYELFKGNHANSRHGTYQNIRDMPEYELDYPPFTELALECGIKYISRTGATKI